MPHKDSLTGEARADREDQEEGKLPRVLTGFMLAFLAGTVLSLAAAVVLLTLQSPRFFNLDLPWIDPALAVLRRLVLVLMVGTVVFKGAVRLYKR